MKRIKNLWLLFIFLLGSMGLAAQSIIAEKQEPNSFTLGRTVICVDDNDHMAVRIAASLLQEDLTRVTGKEVVLQGSLNGASGNIIIVGSLDRSGIVKELTREGKIMDTAIKGKWEAYQLQTITNPVVAVQNALVITGSDRRGTAFGTLEISKQIGVSPWYWWADVPVRRREQIIVKKGITISDAPKVKYRGIFINDEAPALSGWVKEKLGGFNYKFYANVFELMLRLKSNYLWPAMWGNAFYYDDSLNIQTANDFGIVIGTSHHEPLMRAHEEWKYFGNGRKWNYDSTEAGLKEYWRGGMQRAWNEKIVSVGMRGDGDEPMSRETATALLERIVKDQRQIIEEVTGQPASETPQLWALYKEVQDYYDKGMRVPDDVTLLLCDDNWGNIRKLPKLSDKPRKGGYGIYYHFDYVGGPRNYKWLNTNPISRVWEQMHLAYEHGVKDIWIVNVGDIKPMEFPISFWCDYAWNPERIGANDLQKYTEQWSAAQFGNKYAKDIADIISKYTKYNGRRKPELLDANTYSLLNYNESELRMEEYDVLLGRAKEIYTALPATDRDAFQQLVLHPVKACANLQRLYTTVALNREAAARKRPETNQYATRAKQFFDGDSLITQEYHQIGGGKWKHMMSQTHIGYTGWQQPAFQKMPEVKTITNAEVKPAAATKWWISSQADPESAKLRAKPGTVNGFYELHRYVSIEADHFTRAVNTNGINWTILPDHGRTGSSVTPFPVTAPEQKPGGTAPHLEYDFYTYSKDSLKLQLYFSPTLNFYNTANGLQYAVSIDDETPQIISINKEDKNSISGPWNKWVSENTIIKTTRHFIAEPGKHVVKYWMVNPGVVLQKLVIDFGGVKPSYLGPPETRIKK